MSHLVGFGNTLFEIDLYWLRTNVRITLCRRNWEKPNPTTRPSLSVTTEAASQHFSTEAGFN